MKLKNTNSCTQSLNPFLGFGWSTGTKSSKKDLVFKNQQEETEKKNIH